MAYYHTSRFLRRQEAAFVLLAFLSRASRAPAGEETGLGYRVAVVWSEALDAGRGDLAEQLRSR